MMYQQKSFTVPAAPGKITACEACVYGRGPHAKWCPERTVSAHYYFTDDTGYCSICRRTYPEDRIESRRECSGPLPGGKDITVVQTGTKTLFLKKKNVTK
jgi:hypothetical protein